MNAGGMVATRIWITGLKKTLHCLMIKISKELTRNTLEQAALNARKNLSFNASSVHGTVSFQ
jgi:hypothetical protein